MAVTMPKLFIPPVEKRSRVDRSILVLTRDIPEHDASGVKGCGEDKEMTAASRRIEGRIDFVSSVSYPGIFGLEAVTACN
jgi:hypothetical protein